MSSQLCERAKGFMETSISAFDQMNHAEMERYCHAHQCLVHPKQHLVVDIVATTQGPRYRPKCSQCGTMPKLEPMPDLGAEREGEYMNRELAVQEGHIRPVA